MGQFPAALCVDSLARETQDQETPQVPKETKQGKAAITHLTLAREKVEEDAEVSVYVEGYLLIRSLEWDPS